MVETDRAPSWADLSRRQRGRHVALTVLIIVVSWAVLFGIFYLVPFDDRSTAESLVRLFLGIVAFTVVLAVQLHRVKTADLPVLRAVRALGIATAVFLTVFAALYLSLAQGSDTNFSEPLDHTAAVYLTITIFSTVGFGDITPESDVARIVVSIQMILDLIVIGAVVRLLASAVKTGTGAES